jgi:Effector-associated domain 11
MPDKNHLKSLINNGKVEQCLSELCQSLPANQDLPKLKNSLESIGKQYMMGIIPFNEYTIRFNTITLKICNIIDNV